MAAPSIIVRHEQRATERRAPVVPADAAWLVGQGVAVAVEDSPQRAFPISAYAAAGCRIASPGSWVDAAATDYVIGLKELPERPPALRHRHVYFGHAYKGQRDGPALLRRFAAGGGALLDLEYLVDADGRRLAAFGYWAGYLGAALGVLHWRGLLGPPLRSTTAPELADRLAGSTGTGPAPRVVVIGALGRSGRGARDALLAAGVQPTCWDLAETRPLDRPALLEHDILVNTVLVSEPIPPFLTRPVLREVPRRLRLVVDVSCDVGSATNVLPVYDEITTWTDPVRRLADAGPPLDLIAIDNLPSLLPAEASTAFSADLAPHLWALGTGARPWQRCLRAFVRACEAADLEVEPADV